MTDNLTALQGEVSVFYAKSDDYTQAPEFVLLFSSGFAIDGLPVDLGSLSAVTAKDPNRVNASRIIRTIRSNPEINNATFSERIYNNQSNVLERIRRDVNCDNTFWAHIKCTRPDSFNSWQSTIIISGAQLASLDYGALTTATGENDALLMSGSMSYINADRVLPLAMGEEASATVLAEIVRTIISTDVSCGTCAPYDDGRSIIYNLQIANAGSPGLSAQLIVVDTRNGVDTSYDIDTLGGASANDMTKAQGLIIVVSETDESLHYAPTSDLTDWTEVTSGFVGGNGPLVIFALSDTQIFIGAENGYIYGASDPTTGVNVLDAGSATTENILAIHGTGDVLLFGAANNELVYSTDLGNTFDTITTPAGQAGVDISAVFVKTQNLFLVGYADGTLWYTEKGSDSVSSDWVQISLPQNVTYIRDIQFTPDMPEVGAIAADVATASGTRGFIYRTIAGGRPNSWLYELPGIRQLNTLPARYNSVSLAGINRLAAGGLKSGSTDGVIAVGSAND